MHAPAYCRQADHRAVSRAGQVDFLNVNGRSSEVVLVEHGTGVIKHGLNRRVGDFSLADGLNLWFDDVQLALRFAYLGLRAAGSK